MNFCPEISALSGIENLIENWKDLSSAELKENDPTPKVLTKNSILKNVVF